MSDIDTILNNVKTLDQVEILVDVLNRKDVQDYIIFLNTENQLRFGVDSENIQLGTYRSLSYASFKQGVSGRKAGFGVVDLKLSGDYYKTFLVDVLANGDFIIDSNSVKDDKDLRLYSQDLEGLNEKNFDLFIDFIQPLYVQETEKAIFK